VHRTPNPAIVPELDPDASTSPQTATRPRQPLLEPRLGRIPVLCDPGPRAGGDLHKADVDPLSTPPYTAPSYASRPTPQPACTERQKKEGGEEGIGEKGGKRVGGGEGGGGKEGGEREERGKGKERGGGEKDKRRKERTEEGGVWGEEEGREGKDTAGAILYLSSDRNGPRL